MKKTFITIIIILMTMGISVSDSGYIEPCSISPFSFFYDTTTNMVYVGCGGDENSLTISLINPLTLATVKTYTFDGLIESVVPVNSGNSILTLLSDLDGDGYTEDGQLRQIAFSNGNIEGTLNLSYIPLAMVVDHENNYAYISGGLDVSSVNPSISKIDLQTFQKATSDVVYGCYSNSMALTPDGEKLYVKYDCLLEDEQDPNLQYTEIKVFDTQDMSDITSINVDANPSFFQMGYDDRLYIGCETPEEGEPSLLVIDTCTDEYTTVAFQGIGLSDIKIDSIHQKLYGSVLTKQMIPEIEEMAYAPTSMVYEINPENNYSYRVFTVAPEEIGAIIVVPLNNPRFTCRIFSMPEAGDKIYYFDVPRV
jgi:DNA-binding beta-propeller fold protein YncE